MAVPSARGARSTTRTSPEATISKSSTRMFRFLYGSAFSLGRDVLTFYERCERLGGLVQTHVWRLPVFVVTAPELIEEVLVRQHDCFMKSAGLRATERAFGRGLLTSDGALWRQQRKLLQPAFLPRRFQDYLPHVDAALDRLLERYGKGGEHNVYRDLTDLCFEVLAWSLFGESLEEGRERVVAAAAALHRFHLEYARWIGQLGGPLFTLTRRVSTLLGRPDFVVDPSDLPTGFAQSFREALDALDDFAAQLIERRRREPRRGNADLLASLLAARDSAGEPLSDRQLRDEIVTLFFAGHETGAAALAWAVHLLASHPETTQRFQAHLDQAPNGRAAAGDYALQVFQESLRLFPPAFRISRTAVKPCRLGQTTVPAGAEVILPQWAVHRSKRYFEEPQAFRPERWTRDFTRQLPRFAFFPFGGGPRTCIGNHFALEESRHILVRLFSKLSFEPMAERPVEPFLGVTLIPKDGELWLRVRPREACADERRSGARALG